jgi:light-regulated signal transduction histidine kinase (bacteriophytochrome)
VGINAGADDYVAKSASFDVIKARLRAQLRRKQFEDENRRTHEKLLQQQAQTLAARETAKARAELLATLEQKNAELEVLNRELQAFAYSVSHDLRQPLRSMDGFSKVLLDDYAHALDDHGRHYLERIRAGAQRMGQLIDGLLLLSRVTRQDFRRRPLDVAAIARRVVQRLCDAEPLRSVETAIAERLPGSGDTQLVESALENLLGNAWKFTGKQPNARIEVGADDSHTPPAYFVRDNGVGFKMDYADKLFAPFQRLHAEREFSGTGIGLATVQRIIHRHGGKIWAESVPGQGTTFYFDLGAQQGPSS